MLSAWQVRPSRFSGWFTCHWLACCSFHFGFFSFQKFVILLITLCTELFDLFLQRFDLLCIFWYRAAVGLGLPKQFRAMCPVLPHVKHRTPAPGCWDCLGSLDCCGGCPGGFSCDRSVVETFAFLLISQGDNELGHWCCKCLILWQARHCRNPRRKLWMFEGFGSMPKTMSVAWAST